MSYNAAYKRKYDSNHKDEIRVYQKLYRESHKGTRRRDKYPNSLYAKKSYAKNGEKIREKVRLYRIANKEKVIACCKRWVKANPDKMAVISENSRVRRKLHMGGARILGSDWADLKNRFSNMCVYCGASTKLAMDHVIPLSRGGPHHIGNIVPSCKSCNSRKGTKTADEFMPNKFRKGEIT